MHPDSHPRPDPALRRSMLVSRLSTFLFKSQLRMLDADLLGWLWFLVGPSNFHITSYKSRLLPILFVLYFFEMGGRSLCVALAGLA